MNETFTVRRIVNNEGVERILPIQSPFIAKVVVKRSGTTRRAKLFYLRQRVGKSVRLTEERKATSKKSDSESAPAERVSESKELAAAAS